MIKKLILILFILFFFNSCEDTSTKYSPTYQKDKVIIDKKVYIFGVHPLYNPKHLFEIYQPLVDYLNKNLKDVRIELEASRNYDSFNEKLSLRHFDFALPNPYQTLESLKYGYKVFAKMAGDENFRGIILVRKDSDIRSFEDVKGKKISYPASTALAATLLPQYFLHENGIDVNKDIENIYVGSQESALMNIYLKTTDLCATWTQPWEKFKKERPEIANEMKVLWETKSLPNNALVAKDDMPKELVEKISKLILELNTNPEGELILYRINLTHFEKADENTYNIVKDFITDFEQNIREIK
ncbi:MAG: phosphate/phosphite/phosphonate ABC transporter substrate-binding protein [Arcobacter sp.]|jgi:phosphonate transport system substrate-binding protein|uniref:phosphate/phosphite/phosphonate ABC transporter substrate-binding protein n=1 Tax=Arcobacter sp. TaxID=1872629 RepID=UPI002587C8AC|nr:phosphate/phosphite/phosphonate ABC transporter substrate-binding protein [Arcobacter sp.]MDD3008120.1 phosphate/phosphite/phosphonate ABC transporter substrate-binding protein [Arcobacter sp.]MDY3204772.1 phosphate/phosphite/phosphonate ABC transporter substrate-binding protein [Arcobacter sp.]